MSDQLQLLIAGYVLGDLDPQEAAEFEQLLAKNPEIAAEVAQLQEALEIAYGAPAVAPPPPLRTAILEQARVVAPAAIASRPKRSRPAWRSAIDLAAAALIVALGVSNYRLWQALQTPPAARQAALTYSLQATNQASPARATVEVNPATLEATLTAQDLPPLPAGKVYVLWTVLKPGAPFTTDSKKAILTEVFQVDAQGRLTQTIAIPAVYRTREWVTKVAVTIEDAVAPEQHLGSPVLISGS